MPEESGTGLLNEMWGLCRSLNWTCSKKHQFHHLAIYSRTFSVNAHLEIWSLLLLFFFPDTFLLLQCNNGKIVSKQLSFWAYKLVGGKSPEDLVHWRNISHYSPRQFWLSLLVLCVPPVNTEYIIRWNETLSVFSSSWKAERRTSMPWHSTEHGSINRCKGQQPIPVCSFNYH